MNKLRGERDTKLKISDNKNFSVQANGTAGEKTAYDDYRQSLRDIPSGNQAAIDGEDDLDALEAFNPTWPTEPN